jgi:hypothetical protein
LNWSDVTRVTAFKRDWGTVDCICLAIGAKDQPALEVDEEMEGWEAFVNALPKHLPGCKPYDEWFTRVAFPAFATNPTVIYVRDLPEGFETEKSGPSGTCWAV